MIYENSFASTNQNSTIYFNFFHFFHIILKYYSIFNNNAARSRVAHIARDFIACYSYSYYSFMIGSRFGWSFYLKITLRISYAMFSVTQSNSQCLAMIRFLTIFENKLFRISLVSDFFLKFSPFSRILTLFFIRDLSEG